MTSGHTPIRDVGGGGGKKVHVKGGNKPRAAEKTDPLPGLRSKAYHRIYDVTQTDYSWYGDIN